MIDSATVAYFARLADRRHVGESFLGVARYARSRVKSDAWRALSPAKRRKLLRALLQRHTDNGAIYARTMRGY